MSDSIGNENPRHCRHEWRKLPGRSKWIDHYICTKCGTIKHELARL